MNQPTEDLLELTKPLSNLLKEAIKQGYLIFEKGGVRHIQFKDLKCQITFGTWNGKKVKAIFPEGLSEYAICEETHLIYWMLPEELVKGE